MYDNSDMDTQKVMPLNARTAKEFGGMFRAEREAIGKTQQQVASLVGCRRQTIGDLEDGKNVGLVTVFIALSVIGKTLAIKSNLIELEDIRAHLDEADFE